MRKIYSSLLVLAMMMVSVVAKAQYTVDITSDPENNYFSGAKLFAPEEVATALGTDTASLHALLDAGGAVYLKTTDGRSNSYTGNNNEFWMNLDGVPQGYGDEGTSWFVGLNWQDAQEATEESEASDVAVRVYMGQMPNVFKKIYEDSNLKATLYLVSGEKEASFDISLKVNAAEKPNVPDPTTSLAGLDIKKDYTLTLDFVEGKSYEGKTYSTTLDGVYEALGTTADEFDPSVADYTYTQVVKVDSIEGEVQYSWEDRLVLPEEGAGGGWYGRYVKYDEATGNEVTLPMNAPKTWNTGANTFYVQDVKLADGEFSITSGQFPSIMKEGDEDYAYLYLIYGAKAARIKVLASVKKPEVVDPNSYQIVGEQTVTITAAIDNNYATKSFTVDTEAIYAAMECTADDIEDIFAWAAEGELSDNHTEGSGGFYFNDEGFIQSWGSDAAFFVAQTSIANGQYTIGQMANHFAEIKEDTTVKAQFLYKFGAKLYAINVVYTVKAPAQGEEPVEYELVSTDGLSIQIVPSADTYAWENTTQLDLEYIEGKLGTSDFTYYTDKWNATDEKLEWSKNYTCTPAPGFWYGTQEYENEEHQVVVDNAGWGTNSFGVTFSSDGVITWYQYPGQRSVGDSFVANVYLVNEENGKYIKYVLQVLYVDEVRPEAETVLRVEKDAEVTEAGFGESGYFEYTLDTADLFEALGISDLSELEAATFYAAKSSTIFTPVELEELALFGADGYVVPETGNINSMAGFSLEGGLKVLFDPMELAYEKADESKAIARLAIEYDGKRVVYTITFLSEESPLAISAAAAQQTVATGIYSISGARLAAPQKGVNIIRYANGEVKKVLVK